MLPHMSSNPRKRPAPGTTPTVPIPQMQYPSPNNDQLLKWEGGMDASGFVDGSAQGVNPYGIVPAQQPAQYPAGVPVPSNTVARRQMNRALVPTGPRAKFDGTFDTTNDAWAFIGDEAALLQQPSNGNMADHDNVELLEEQAQQAKRDAQAKRKQIPPFVQKLSSFLDEEKNLDLIRWSEKGDSFIVLDEDEFAKTLIPELFKHNNYASFVRQLNMYGFHKRVGLSDNSMRASERKNKSPSEYSNPYFRRGHPNLLWLINKSKSGGKGKKGSKGAEGDGDSEDEMGQDDGSHIRGVGAPIPPAARPALPPAEMPLQKKEITVIREELAKVREQQKLILNAISRLQRENTNLYQQAVMFQTQHDRHQNSINAILNFLANVFRKTLEDQGGSQNVNELLASIIPNGQVPQGSVVDLGDFVQAQSPALSAMGVPKRARGLLPPIPGQGRASTVSPSPSSTATPQPFNQHNPQMGTITELFDPSPSDHTSPNYLAQELESNPHESMMKIINDTNANRSSGIDLPDVVANTPATLSNDQRNKMLSIMAGQSSANSSNMPTPIGIKAPSTPMTQPLNTPQLPSMPATTSAPLSLSPIMGSAMPPPSLQQINFNNKDLETLQRMQEEQAAKLDHLSSMLGPLSPSGRIPGIDENGNVGSYFDNADVDIDQFLNPDTYLDNNPDFTGFGSDGNDFNFNLDGTADGQDHPGRVVEAGSTANNTPSPSGTEEIARDDLGYAGSPNRDAKRRRMG